jgi:hypothetical protein
LLSKELKILLSFISDIRRILRIAPCILLIPLAVPFSSDTIVFLLLVLISFFAT